MNGSIAKLDTEMVNIYRRRMGLKPRHLSQLLGYKQPQGYYYMMKTKSLARVADLAKLFECEKRSLVVIEK
jgi:hypothetical protein